MRTTDKNVREKIGEAARRAPDQTDWEQLYALRLDRLRNFIARRWKADPNLADEVATMALSSFWEKRLFEQFCSDPVKLFGRLVFLARDCLCKLGRQRRRLRGHEVPLGDKDFAEPSTSVDLMEPMLAELGETLSPALKRYYEDRLGAAGASGVPLSAANRRQRKHRTKRKAEAYLRPRGQA
jgi:hypothetical protein